MKKGSLKNYDGATPSLYVGESARSLQERSKEHLAAFEAGNQNSHILKHQESCHGGSKEQKFVFKIVGAPKSALSRQVGEAIRIRNRVGRGGDTKFKGGIQKMYNYKTYIGGRKTRRAKGAV